MQIYCLPITQPTWEENDTKLLAFVSAQRQSKIMKYLRPIDQKLSLYAALLARMGLSITTGLAASELTFNSIPNHKPTLQTDPQYDFSFSHTHSFILLGITFFHAVGVDVEQISTTPPYGIMNSVFHPEEIAMINHAPSSEKNRNFYIFWTKKEAYTKYLGTGLVENLTAINTLAPDLANSFFTWQQDNYICSVFSPASVVPQLTTISETALSTYFIPDQQIMNR